jgi:hypothetical protein
VATERDSVLKMFGELAREFGLLYFTFGLLDAHLAETERGGTLGASWFREVLFVGMAAMVVGMYIERKRSR